MNGKISKAITYVESEPLQMALELVPVLTVLFVMLLTGMLVRTSAREVISFSEAAASLMRTVEGKFESWQQPRKC